ncbi:FISUMP domain-containing protein [candidate division KSB1 bacterium]
MKTKLLLTVAALFFVACAFSQKLSVDLTFTAINNTAYIQLDSIKVMNRTHPGDTIVYWADTSLTVNITAGDTLLYIGYTTASTIGIQEVNYKTDNFRLFQNYPNPVNDFTVFSVNISEKGNVQFLVTDISGKEVLRAERILNKGIHSFSFSPGNGNFFLLTAWWKGINRSIKIITTEFCSQKKCTIDYIEGNNSEQLLKKSSVKQGSMQESGILDAPLNNNTYTFEFATNIPCLGTPSVTYDGQVYNTIQIFSQCWLKENLNVGTMINGGNDQTNNDSIEKYCYNNNPDSCAKYGGLYQWDEMMQYTTQQGAQGICPPGWHLPADEEWKVLEGAVDSQYGIGDLEWDITWAYRSFNAGSNLKTTSGWYYNSNGTDLFGFSAMPSGYRYHLGLFSYIGTYGDWWTSTKGSNNLACYRCFYYFYPEKIYQGYFDEIYGFSVRCVMDN